MSDETTESTGLTLRDLDAEQLKQIGVNEVKISASCDTKVSIAQFETMGVQATMELSFDFSAFTGTLPVNDIVNQLVLPARNSFARFAHAETMGRVNEMRAIIEGVRDGKQLSDIERDVQAARTNAFRLMRAAFETR